MVGWSVVSSHALLLSMLSSHPIPSEAKDSSLALRNGLTLHHGIRRATTV